MKRLFILLAAALITGTAGAQQAQTMYIIHNNTVTHQIPLSEIDTIVFETPALTPTIYVTGVTLNYDALSIPLGRNERLIPTVLPTNATNRNIGWRSSNPAVASINANGVVTALSLGTTTITVTTACGAHTATTDVTVVPIAVTDVMLNRNSTTITIGGTETLTATIIPANATNRNLTWSTCSPFVASVDADGEITTISVGEATITVTTDCGQYTATCTVTVAPIFVTGVALNMSAVQIFLDRTIQLTATIAPATATNRNVNWASNNAAVATVDANGRVRGVGVGTAIILATTECGARTASATITVSDVPGEGGVMINGIVWATSNIATPGVFAATPETHGGLFTWANRNVCPPGWRVPTQAELTSLNNAGHIWTSQNGVNGRVFGQPPNQIFLPAAGWRSTVGALNNVGSYGFYWSSTPSGTTAWSLYFHSTSSNMNTSNQGVGHSVRCVAE